MRSRHRTQVLLRRAVRVARKLETLASETDLRRRPLLIAGYGFLVRNRRLAAAISQLERPSAYEAGVLVRTMLEIKINYAWIRLTNTYSRARRCCRHWPLDRLRLLEKAASIFRPNDYEDRKRLLEQARRRVRGLFRFRDRKGRMRWANSWAQVDTVEARLAEVQKNQNAGEADLFQYALYIALSSAVHGSPESVERVLRIHKQRLRPARQPEGDPERHARGALVLLMWTVDMFATDSKLKRALRPEIHGLASAVKAEGEGPRHPAPPRRDGPSRRGS